MASTNHCRAARVGRRDVSLASVSDIGRFQRARGAVDGGGDPLQPDETVGEVVDRTVGRAVLHEQHIMSLCHVKMSS